MNLQSEEIVVSGLGVVGPCGVGVAPLAAALASGRAPAAVAVDRSAGFHRGLGSRKALLTRDAELAALLPPGASRRMSRPARFAVAATQLALADAGLADADRALHSETAIVSGTAFGPPLVTEQLLRQIFGAGPESASPALFSESVASAAASQVAMAIRARGPNIAFTGREASDLLALGAGFRLLALRQAERVLVLVVDEMIPLLHALLDRFRALARPGSDGLEVARPFDRRRDGFVVSEGAVVALLEPRRVVEERRGPIRAHLLAAGAGFDPSAPPHDFGSGISTHVAAWQRGLTRAGIEPADLALIVAGASGARRSDLLLGRALRELSVAGLPPVLAPKGLIGEFGGGFLGAAILHAGGAPAAVPDGFTADPEIGVVPLAVHGGPAPRRTFVASVAAGGAHAWAVLGAGAPPRLPPPPAV